MLLYSGEIIKIVCIPTHIQSQDMSTIPSEREEEKVIRLLNESSDEKVIDSDDTT